MWKYSQVVQIYIPSNYDSRGEGLGHTKESSFYIGVHKGKKS